MDAVKLTGSKRNAVFQSSGSSIGSKFILRKSKTMMKAGFDDCEKISQNKNQNDGELYGIW
jgi:hypothetical protein